MAESDLDLADWETRNQFQFKVEVFLGPAIEQKSLRLGYKGSLILRLGSISEATLPRY